MNQAAPTTAIDIAQIEEGIKMANLDTLRGYSNTTPAPVQQAIKTEYTPMSQAAGYQVIREPMWNKGEPFISCARVLAQLQACHPIH